LRRIADATVFDADLPYLAMTRSRSTHARWVRTRAQSSLIAFMLLGSKKATSAARGAPVA
jgi:hypothetical protein